MATLATQRVIGTGLAPTYSAAAGGGDKMETGDTQFLHCKNGGGVSVTVTIDSVRACDQGFDHNLAVVINAGAEAMIGPVTTSRFAAASDGLAAITYSGVTSVTVAALELS